MAWTRNSGTHKIHCQQAGNRCTQKHSTHFHFPSLFHFAATSCRRLYAGGIIEFDAMLDTPCRDDLKEIGHLLLREIAA